MHPPDFDQLAAFLENVEKLIPIIKRTLFDLALLGLFVYELVQLVFGRRRGRPDR